MSDSLIIANRILRDPLTSGGDGFQVFGDPPCKTTITGCIIDFSAHKISELDEAVSGINGAVGILENTNINGVPKSILWGNGDYPESDKERSTLHMQGCTIQNFSRRAPEAQDGAKVTMVDCVIKNWGIKNRFNVRSFGAWAHSGAAIHAKNCSFIQDSFFQTGFLNFFKDILNHLGNTFNYKNNDTSNRFRWLIRGISNIRFKDFIPGVCRGLTSSDTGKVSAENCKKNKWWIRIENNTRYK